MSKPTINPEALKQFAVVSNELLNLMRAVNLDGQARSAESKANESSSSDSNSASQESFITAPNSLEDSLEYSFGSLNITASQWEEIDRETAPLPEEKPMSATTEDRPRKARQPSISTTDPLTSSTYSTKKTTPDIKPGEALGEVQIHTKYRFSPSVLAHHANTACEKMLHLKGAELWAKSQRPKHQDTKDNSPGTIAQAHQERGLDYEARLQQKIQKKIDCESQRDEDSFFRLATSEIGTTLCQPIFSLDDSFYTPEMTQAGIEFGRFIPDFIRIVAGSKRRDGTCRNRLFIIDAKSSLQVKISHQFQVTLYAIFLDHLIKLNKQQDNIEIDIQGGVWIPSDPEPKTFSLSFMRPIVERFMLEELPAILSKPLKNAEWHIDGPCGQCEFLPRCRVDAETQKTLSLIPLLSKRSALWIKGLMSPTSRSEIEDLEDLVKNRHNLSAIQQTSLEDILYIDGRGNSILLESYRSRKSKVLPLRTLELPMKHNERLLVNALFNPLHRLPYAYSLDQCREQQFLPTRTLANAIGLSNNPEVSRMDHIALTEEFVDALHGFLVQISNLQHPPVLSIFFYSRSTQNDVQKLLLKIVSKESEYQWKVTTKTRAMELLGNMYEDADFLTMSEVAGQNIQMPDLLGLTNNPSLKTLVHDKRVFAIEAAIHALLVLPSSNSYSYPNIMTQLVDIEAPGIIDERDRDDQGYNNDSIYESWVQGKRGPEVMCKVKKWAEQQNVILLTLYGVLRDECKDLGSILLAPQKTFRMRSRLNVNDSILAQFAYFLEWETIVQVQRLRERRVLLSKQDSFAQQASFELSFVERVGNVRLVSKTSAYIAKFIVTSQLNPGALANDSFPNWILSADTEEGQRSRMKYDDMKDVLNIYGYGAPAVVGIESVVYDKNIVYVKGSYDAMTVQLGVDVDKKFILERREYAPNLNTTLKKLVAMNTESKLFLELITDPNKWGLESPKFSNDVFLESILSSTRQYDMTTSQDHAFTRVIRQRMNIIWGPPGSGKTQFLALTILRYIDIMRGLSLKGQGKGPQTIVLTALTHSAIDNLVARVLKLHETVAPHAGYESMIRPLLIYRIGGYNQAQGQQEGVITMSAADFAAKHTKHEDPRDQDVVRIVCGTVWGIRKAAFAKTPALCLQNIQMLMIDEGSQLLTVDALHAIECLDPDAGRLIVAGDHLQLGPVIVGDYPPSSQTIDPTGSIMKNLMRTAKNKRVDLQWDENRLALDVGPCTSQLQDNFRMNKQLGEFMQSIYGPSFRVQNPTKALPYGEFRGMSFPAEIRKILDRDLSATCVELQLTTDRQCQAAVKVRANTRTAAIVEAAFVAGLVDYYLTMVGAQTVTSVFVAVPHHVQRLAILNAVDLDRLAQDYPLAKIKVDTIEKMQGQEADFVVVGFALFGDATVTKELRHLYSVHRWVVALSRARCKTVLLMTPEMLSPRIVDGGSSPSAADMDYLDGWGLLHAFEKYSRETGGKTVYPIGREFLELLQL
ncbi:Tripartite DNA replication factor [Haplosporangium bisporale]|nr:Tripartite DNA replication factor [Haplosporangium bisporale]